MANAIIATVFAALGLASPPVTDVEGSRAQPPSLETTTPTQGGVEVSGSPNVADKSPGAPLSRQGSEATPAQARILDCIASHESNGYADKRSATHRGRYQFSWSTWRSVGGSGDPADASPAEQDMRALALYQREGLRPCPPARNCA